MTSGFFSRNGGQRGYQTQQGRVTRAGCSCAFRSDASGDV